MAEKLQIYKCDLCGNIVEVLHGGALYSHLQYVIRVIIVAHFMSFLCFSNFRPEVQNAPADERMRDIHPVLVLLRAGSRNFCNAKSFFPLV